MSNKTGIDLNTIIINEMDIVFRTCIQLEAVRRVGADMYSTLYRRNQVGSNSDKMGTDLKIYKIQYDVDYEYIGRFLNRNTYRYRIEDGIIRLVDDTEFEQLISQYKADGYIRGLITDILRAEGYIA